jgi:cysteinyl-tRNA synthetase
VTDFARLRAEFPQIRLYNTMTRRKEKFIPQKPQNVTFYSCGQTLYEKLQIGNAKTYLVWDILSRTLEFFGYNVFHVQNFTDLGHLTDDQDQGEDKITLRASKRGIHPMELVEQQIELYHKHLDALNIRRPKISPRATGHITEMIDMTHHLLQKGYAYEVNGTVYFDVSKFKNYTKLAKLNLENQVSGEKYKNNKEKRNPNDFAIWIKAPPNHIMQYSSPWGKGYPGWHIECSVMALKYLGETIDIHAGGVDHIPVHHTNEIAQSESYTGKKFAKYWIHSAFITVNGIKMSKSLDNFVTLEELISKTNPAVSRLTLINMHYRKQGDFSWDDVIANKNRFTRWIRIYHKSLIDLEVKKKNLLDDQSIINFATSLADDLNFPKAIYEVQSVIDRLDLEKDTSGLNKLINSFELMLDVLGIPYPKLTSDDIIHIQALLNLRNDLRAKNNFKEADLIRNHLKNLGYIIEDEKNQISWFKII